MITRRDLLRFAAAAAAWPGLAGAQAGKAKAPPPGVPVNDLHSQLNSTRVFRIDAPQDVAAVRTLVAEARKDARPLCISGARHAMGGQQFCADALMLDMRKMNRVLSFDRERGLIEVEAGIQWPELLSHLVLAQRGAAMPWAFAQKQTGADRLTLGGALAANIHGRGLAMPPFVHDVESFRLVTARGNVVNCSRSDNAELFRLAIGGYGLFGVVTSLTLRLVPRRKLERVVEVRDVDGLPGAFAERIREGHLYGDFQYAIDENSGDFLRRGVFCTYRPVEDERPVPAVRNELTERDLVELLFLAHTDKFEAFRRYAAHYQSTDGQLYWSDEQQMGPYPEDYHRTLDRRLSAPARGSETITEIYCERDALEPFMAEARATARRDGMNIIYGTVRLVEEDRESFLAWARKPYACVVFNLHIEHTTRGMIRAGDALRRLVDVGLRHGGGYYLTYNRYALERQVRASFPQLPEFLKLKRKYDPQELFQSEWYRHYKRMFFPER
ncbi:MAG TPA: FAD-binding oxidoreductase [Burkholderiales bacterium]|nr:FAD-binding oxidoreductase [Burkholderiales bacterium]